ncbi:MAG: hypothetical protein KDI39_08445, partial [Pseudomonadales bacterium]|nr:hypothetical protein [Pseudomonadales bacterium]
FFFKVFKCLSLLAISGIFFGYILGEFFIDLLFGKAFYGAYSILLVFLLVFAITTPSVLLGYPFLGALGHMNAVNKSVVFAGIVQIGLLVILTYTASISAIYVVFSVLIVELTVLIFRAVYARKIYINKDYSVHTNSSKSA